MKRVLVVEDEASIREMVALNLKMAGWEVLEAPSAERALELMHQSEPCDAALLDIMLPGMDGLEVLRRLRGGRETAEIPVIMLTARTAEMDRVAGLESGADDYVVKPFGLMELQARIKAVLRRTRRQENGVLRCGELEVDPAARTVRRGGEPVELTYKEFELLRLLVSRRGSVLTRDEILHAVWDYDFTGETRTVDMHIKSLRQKLGDGFISTVRGVGYKIN